MEIKEIQISRYNPRQDKEALLELVKDFEYRVGKKINLENFSAEIDKRSKDLKLRNSLILAKGKSEYRIIGAGFFSLWTDHLGYMHCYVHHVITRKEDAYKLGIEEKILRELFAYLKKTMKIEKVILFAKKTGDSNLQSIFMKLGIKKGDVDLYEHAL